MTFHVIARPGSDGKEMYQRCVRRHEIWLATYCSSIVQCSAVFSSKCFCVDNKISYKKWKIWCSYRQWVLFSSGWLSTWIAHVLQTTLRNINFFIVEWEKSYDEFFQTNFDNFVQSKICRWPQKRKKKFVNYWGQRLLNFRLAEKVDFSKELQKYWQKSTVSQPTLKTHFETFHTRSNPLFIGLPVANNMFPLESDLFFYFDLFLGM